MSRYIILSSFSILLLLLSSSCCDQCSQEAREQFAREVELQIKTFDARIQQLKADAAELGQAARVELDGAVATLVEMKEAAVKKLAELKGAGAEAWEEMEPELREAMKRLEAAFEKAKASFD